MLAACSGGGGSPYAGANAGGGGSSPASSSRANVTFEMQWAPASSAPASALRRSPKYLAPTALSVSITVVSAPAPFTTATPIVEVLNNPTSTITFSAPTGLDTFLIQTYDEPNGGGNVLSNAEVTQTVSGSSANVVSATLNGVIAALKLSVSPLQPTAGTATSMTVSATTYDADGNVIVGPGGYASPVQLAIVDPSNSGALSLTNTVLQLPGATTTLQYNGAALMSASVSASAPGVTPVSVAIAPVPTAYYIPIPTANANPTFITSDAAGNVWWTETDPSISRIGEYSGGKVTEYSTPTANAGPYGITPGSDGRVWFTENSKGQIGAITAAGNITEYPVFDSALDPAQLIDRGDGNIWYTTEGEDKIGFQSETNSYGNGAVTLPESPTAIEVTGIAAAADGYLYFSETNIGKIGRLHDADSTIQEISVPALSGAGSPQPGIMVKGPDGNIWFTDGPNSAIGCLHIPAFTVTMYPTASPGANPIGITAGPDGALWYVENGLDKIGRITTAGVATDYGLGATNLGLSGLVFKSNGALFFTAAGTNQIGKFIY